MSLQSQLQPYAPGVPTVVTVGTFDGVHVGHAQLFRVTGELARAARAETVAITFRRPPRSLLNPELPSSFLCPLGERLALIRAAGIDHVIEVDFDESVRSTPAEEFVRILIEVLDMRGLVLGPGATVGKDRGGNEARIAALAESLGFALRIVQPAEVDGQVVRSTAIRAALTAGDVGGAARMLGRPFSITGLVSRGEGRGRRLGFPTANITPEPEGALPADGIYATIVIIHGADGVDAEVPDADVAGSRFMAATNVGVRPTFEGDTRLIEPYLLDFDGDLYGRRISVEFIHRLREEARFEDVDDLVAQIGRDVEETRRLLSGSGDRTGTR